MAARKPSSRSASPPRARSSSEKANTVENISADGRPSRARKSSSVSATSPSLPLSPRFFSRRSSAVAPSANASVPATASVSDGQRKSQAAPRGKPKRNARNAAKSVDLPASLAPCNSVRPD